MAEGPGEFALGRGELALGNADAAVDHLRRAWGRGQQGPAVAYALGLATGKVYRRELQQADAIGNATLRESRRREIQASLRDPAVAYLKQGAGVELTAPEYVEGLIALYEKRDADALDLAGRALKRSPWLHEALVLQGDVYAKQSQGRHEKGDADGSRAALAEAEAAYARAAEIARSDPEVRDGLCQVALQRVEWLVYTTTDVGAVLHEGARRLRGGAAGRRRQRRGPRQAREPPPLPRRPADGAGTGSDCRPRPRDPGSARGPEARARQPSRPRQPRRHLAAARPVADEPRPGSYRGARAGARVARPAPPSWFPTPVPSTTWPTSTWRAADFLQQQGKDPRPDLAQAVAGYRRALALVPDFAFAHGNLGITLTKQARAEMDRGISAGSTLEEAAKALDRTAELMHGSAMLHGSLADVHPRPRRAGAPRRPRSVSRTSRRHGVRTSRASAARSDTDGLASAGRHRAPRRAPRAIGRADPWTRSSPRRGGLSSVRPSRTRRPPRRGRSLARVELLDARGRAREKQDPSAAIAAALAAAADAEHREAGDGRGQRHRRGGAIASEESGTGSRGRDAAGGPTPGPEGRRRRPRAQPRPARRAPREGGPAPPHGGGRA